jgi:hypothetical protein
MVMLVAAIASALPFAPTSWQSLLPATSSAYNKNGVFFLDWGNKTVGMMSPVTGGVVWTSASLHEYVDLMNNALVATDDVVMLAANLFVGSPMLWTFNATTGETLTNTSVSFNCLTLLTPVCSAHFVCIDNTKPTVATVMDMFGSSVWSSAAEGLQLMSYTNIFCVESESPSASSQVAYFPSYSASDDLFALVLLDVSTGVVTTVPNVVTATAAYNGVAFAVLSDNSVGALVLSSSDSHRYLTWLWNTTAVAGMIEAFDGTTSMYVVGTVLMLYGVEGYSGVFAGLGLSDGSFLGTLTLAYIGGVVPSASGPQGLNSVAVVGPYLAVAYTNNTVSKRDAFSLIDPVLMSVVTSSSVIPGNSFVVIEGNASCSTSLFVPNGMGFSRVAVTPESLQPVSYNLQLPGVDSQIAFSNTPRAGLTTIVVWVETNITGIVFSC